jgi:hypothetical protein
MAVRTAERDRSLAAQQVVMGLRLHVEDQALEVEPEVLVGDRQLAHLAALRHDEGQPPPLVIEVPVLDAPQRPLADPVIEQQPQRDPIPKVIVSGKQPGPILRRDRLAVNVAFLRPLDRKGRVALDVAAQLVMPEEVMQNREGLVERAPGAGAPLVVEELLQAFGADRRLEVVEVKVSEVAGQLVEARLVVAIRRFGQAAPFRSQVVAGA